MSTIEALRGEWMRPASRMILGGFRPPSDPAASWFGRVNLALPDEGWPMLEGRAILPLCQINVSELPYAPDGLAGVALLTLFVNDVSFEWDGRSDGRRLPMPGAPNGEGWMLRTYSSLSSLVPLEAPEKFAAPRAFPVRWELVEDFPGWDDAPHVARVEGLANVHATKVGGWPSPVQADVSWDAARVEYVFQIDSEEKAGWAWGDAGTGYFGRNTGTARDTWQLSWQSY